MLAYKVGDRPPDEPERAMAYFTSLGALGQDLQNACFGSFADVAT